MRNLITFFRRFRVFLVFAFLQVVALSMYFTFLNYPNARVLTTASSIGSYFLEIRHSITHHFSLEEANVRLQKENIRLRRQLPESFIPIQSSIYKINDTLFDQQYNYLPATVINSTYTKRNNFLTINVGKYQGVQVGMGVFNKDGIVGTVFHVSEHYSLVRTLLTEQINLAVALPDGAFGLLKWDGKKAKIAQVSGIPNDIQLNVGDAVVSRGSRMKFPRHYPIGKIISFEKINGSSRWHIDIELAVDFRKITNVYVIKNVLKTEQKKLEKRIINER